jgi:glycosyltransferase involved in cell wall biosynthesis
MHLCLFLHALSTGGAQRRSIMLANGLAARGHRVDLVTVAAGGPQAAMVASGVHHLALRPGQSRMVASGGARSADLVAGIKPLASYLRANRPDLLMAMANHAVLPAIAAHMLGAHRETRLVLRASNHLSRRRDSGISLRRLPESWLWRRADAVLAVSDDVAADVQRTTGVAAERIYSVPSPILPDDLRIPETGSQVTGEPVILAMGRFVRQKGFDILLHAFARLRQRRAAQLVLAGDGPDMAALKALAASLGIASDVTFPGLVADPFIHMATADLFVLPSRWEGMPGVLVEAMSMGCPVVSTDCPGGSRELLRHGVLGPLVPVDDAAALADAMDGALNHPVPAAALRQRAAAFTVERAVDSYERSLLLAAAGGVSQPHRAGKDLIWHLD